MGVGLVVAVIMVLLGMEPRLLLVACIVAAVGGAAWLVVDLGATAGPIMWNDFSSVPEAGTATDRRVQVLRGSLRRGARNGRVLGVGAADQVASDEIAETLLGLIDDHLLTEYGIDRTVDPAAAVDAVGSDLAPFIRDVAARRSMTQRRALPRTLALIEDLESSPPTI